MASSPSPITAPAAPITPGITVSVERQLLLKQHPDGRAPHLAAASGIVHAGSTTYVVADDELYLGVFASPTLPGELRRIFAGSLPKEAVERKQAKPDLEALTLMPPSTTHPSGALLGLGSGSKDNRNRGFVWALDASSALSGEPKTIDLTPLYAEQKSVKGTLNIEGVSVRGDEALLFHRGNTKGGQNAIARVAATRLVASAQDGKPVSASALRGVVNYDLGSIAGVPLTFADARSLPDGRVLFLATAERTDDPVGDGPIAGSAVGLLGAAGELGKLWKVEGPARKLEGVDVTFDAAGVAKLTLVTDADNPAKPAEQLRATLPPGLADELARSARG